LIVLNFKILFKSPDSILKFSESVPQIGTEIRQKQSAEQIPEIKTGRELHLVRDLIARTHIITWTTEILADLLALNLIDPVYLLSLKDYLIMRYEFDYTTLSHPSPYTRIRILSSEFDNLGYRRELKSRGTKEASEYLDHFDGISRWMNKQHRPSSEDEYLRLVNYSVLRMVPLLSKVARAATSDRNYSPKLLVKEAFQLSRQLESLIPPAEIDVGAPANPISILNAGAIFKLMKFDKVYGIFDIQSKTSNRLIIDRKVDTLVVKAIELATLQDQMQTIKSEKK
jgi:hypothetical protein